MTFNEELKDLIEKHHGKIEDMKSLGPLWKSEVFDDIYQDLVKVMRCDYTYTLQIVQLPDENT